LDDDAVEEEDEYVESSSADLEEEDSDEEEYVNGRIVKRKPNKRGRKPKKNAGESSYKR
jgi:hypothetical protein